MTAHRRGTPCASRPSILQRSECKEGEGRGSDLAPSRTQAAAFYGVVYGCAPSDRGGMSRSASARSARMACASRLSHGMPASAARRSALVISHPLWARGHTANRRRLCPVAGLLLDSARSWRCSGRANVNVGHSNLFRTLSAPNEFRLPIRKFRTRHIPSTRWARPHSFRLEAVPTPSSTNRSGSACAFPQFRAHFPYLREQVKEQAPRAKAWRKTVQPLDGSRVRSGAQRLDCSQGHFCQPGFLGQSNSRQKVFFPEPN